MNDELQELYEMKRKAILLKDELENLEAKISEKMLLVITELCFTDKKLTYNNVGDGLKLELQRKDYKKFAPDVQFELNKAKKQYEDTIKPMKENLKNEQDAIKRQAEDDKKVKIEPKWYAYIKAL
jgi:hypothetical protein